MFFRCFYRPVELVSSGNKLRKCNCDFRWVHNLSGEIYNRVSNVSWLSLFKVIGTDMKADLVLWKLQTGFKVVFHSFCSCTRERLYNYSMATASPNFVPWIFFIIGCPINRVVLPFSGTESSESLELDCASSFPCFCVLLFLFFFLLLTICHSFWSVRSLGRVLSQDVTPPCHVTNILQR